MPESEIRRYRFGPLERRGLIGSLRATQVIPMAVSLADPDTGGRGKRRPAVPPERASARMRDDDRQPLFGRPSTHGPEAECGDA